MEGPESEKLSDSFSTIVDRGSECKKDYAIHHLSAALEDRCVKTGMFVDNVDRNGKRS